MVDFVYGGILHSSCKNEVNLYTDTKRFQRYITKR